MTTALQPTDAEIDAAVEVSGEHSSEQSVRERAHDWPVSGRKCASCGVFEDDDGPDASENLRSCVDCGDCYIHPYCASDKRCPHCRVIAESLYDARAMLDLCPDVSLVFALGQIAAAKRRCAGVPE